MTAIIAIILDGIVLGLQFGLLAAGLTLVYGLGGVLNLAYGQMAVISAIVVAFAMDAAVPLLPAVGLGLLAGGLLGLLFDLTILRPVYRLHDEGRVLLSLLLTLGVSFIVDGFLMWRFPLKALTLHMGGGAVEILGVPMRRGSLVASAITLVTIAGLFVFFQRTSLGQAVRSVFEDEEGARMVGIYPSRMLRLILILSGMLAALVAVMFFGRVVGGSKRWLAFGSVSLQPSEMAKIAVIIILARYYAKLVNTSGLTLRELFTPAILTMIPFALIVQQPDLGTAGVVALIAVSMTIFVKIERRSFTYLSLFGVATDAVLVNRVLPAEAARGYFARWAERERQELEEIERSFPVPLFSALLRPSEPIGVDALRRLASEVYGERDPAGRFARGRPSCEL